jgi:hypothetical protein
MFPQTGVAQVPAEQNIDVQSVATPHISPSAHGMHIVPPQSTSVSVPFIVPSVHVGSGWQVPPVQMSVVQSPLPPHMSPGVQVGPHVPPQSTSDSVPFIIPSVHVGAGGPPSSCASAIAIGASTGGGPESVPGSSGPGQPAIASRHPTPTSHP